MNKRRGLRRKNDNILKSATNTNPKESPEIIASSNLDISANNDAEESNLAKFLLLDDSEDNEKVDEDDSNVKKLLLDDPKKPTTLDTTENDSNLKPKSEETEKPMPKSRFGINFGGKKKNTGTNDTNITENNAGANNFMDENNENVNQGPMQILEPIRGDPIKTQKLRQKRLERLPAENLPEIHFVGSLASIQGHDNYSSNGFFVRWSVSVPPAWLLLEGETIGQTQVIYNTLGNGAPRPLNHPLDLHFAQSGLQGWGAAHIAVQTFSMDLHGRRILEGYGFAHLPLTKGFHSVEISTWRPVGTPEQEVGAYFLGRVPSLASHETIYDSAWKDRYRLTTVHTGKVIVELFVITRFLKEQGLDIN